MSNEREHDTLEYDLSLRFVYDATHERFVITPIGRGFSNARVWDPSIRLSQDALRRYVDELVSAWHNAIETPGPTGSGPNEKPLQERADLRNDGAFLQTIAAPLVEAGRKLRYLLFENGDEQLREFNHALQDVMRQGRMIRVISSDCFVPWGLLYDQALEGEDVWDGFWGIRHVIDHEPLNKGPRVAIKAASALPISLAVDMNLVEDRLGDSPHIQYFANEDDLDVDVLNCKEHLSRSMRDDAFAQAIVYFLCHGSDGGLRLTDGEQFNGSDIEYWVGERDLRTNPFVFINACEGAITKVNSYDAVSQAFLKRGAAGALATHLQIPEVFGCAYAERFFGRLLAGDAPRVGPLVRDLAQMFVRELNNPLGLTYTLYRASDVYIDRRKLETE